MKQRLLLVLLALFTSIGWMNADVTLTIPKGATGSLSFTAAKDGQEVLINNEKKTSPFSINDLVKENEKTVTISGDLATLTINTKVTNVTVGGMEKLTSLVFSETAGSDLDNKLTFPNFSGKLKTLTVNKCGLTELPTNMQIFDEGATASFKNNELTDVSYIITNSKVTYNFDGNKIIVWPTLSTDSKATINYGSQSSAKIELPTSGNIIANEWFDIYTALKNQYYKMVSASQLNYKWRKGTSGTFSETLIKKSDTYAGNFQFYSGGEYQSGTYQCQVSPTTGVSAPTYVVTVDVKAAKFKLKIETEPTEGGTFEIANSNNKVTSESTDITKGEQLIFSATKNTGYTFSEYEVVGLSKVSDNVYKVDGHGEDKVLSAKAIFKKNTYKITVDASTEHGSYVITNTTDNSEVTNGKTVSHNDKLTIKATPEEGYTPRVIVNQEEKNYITGEK